MNLRGLPLPIDDPVEVLLAFHRRIERQLATLGALPVYLEVRGVDGESSAQAASCVSFFRDAIALHHADEGELLALLQPRVRSGVERGEFDDLRHRVESEHRQMEVTWRGLRRPLEGIAEGVARRLPADLLYYFRALNAGHIAEEEANLHLIAARELSAGDRAALARGMAARRVRRYRFQ